MLNDSREQIFAAIRANIPREPVERPRIPVFTKADADLKLAFEKHLEEAGGAAYDIGDRAEA
jgi:hypothetical protein